MIRMAIETARRCGRTIGICGQAPSDDLKFARFLAQLSIDTIRLNPDAVLAMRLGIAAMEREARG